MNKEQWLPCPKGQRRQPSGHLVSTIFRINLPLIKHRTYEDDHNFYNFNYQAHGDLVASVDFNSSHLVCGFEDANVGVWDIKNTTQLHLMGGHNGGVTGIQLQVIKEIL